MAKRDYHRQFEILREIALASSSGEKAEKIAHSALKKSSEVVGISAGSLIVWSDSEETLITAEFTSTDKDKELLDELEKNLFSDLRTKRSLESAYISFGGKNPMAAFSLPIKKGDKILGAVMGIQPGIGSLVKEDEFLETLSSLLSIAILVSQYDNLLKNERFEAVMATATAVNHGINNPLQAALGIVQLLPKEIPDLDKRILKKLKAIEESVLAITKITHKLMHISEINYVDYIDGTKMLELPKDIDPQ